MSQIIKKTAIAILSVLFLFSCEKEDSVTPIPEQEEPAIVAEFRTKLSELNLFTGNISDLNIASKAVEYSLSTPLFSDYSYKQRLIALPENTAMEFDGAGLPIFPDNTVIAKTFYYNIDERDVSLGRQIIETRLLIKLNGAWETGNYKWNEDQTDAVLDVDSSTLPVTWIDANGDSNSIQYRIPSDADCLTCHSNSGAKKPLGLKLRNLNFEFNGSNQLQRFIDENLLSNLQDISNVRALPQWDDASNHSLQDRARAYMDVNCAHCHTAGGTCEDQSPLRLDYETSLGDSQIQTQKQSIIFRVSSDFQSGQTMPWIGTTILHNEGVNVMLDYLNTL